MRRLSTRLCTLGAALVALGSGCGAAYYGTAIGIIASQTDNKNVDTSFPDGVPTAPVVPSTATLRFGAPITVERSDQGTFLVEGSEGEPVQVTDVEVLGLEFPPSFGRAVSNRDAGVSMGLGQIADRIVVRINRDVSRELTFDAGELAAAANLNPGVTQDPTLVDTGAEVARLIQNEVRALSPLEMDVPAEAYTLFEASYDPTTGAYTFESGAAGEISEVVFEPTPRGEFPGDALLDADSARTALRLGLGEANGGIELEGGETLRFDLINRGTDVIPQGTAVNLFLSRDKILDPGIDIPIDQVAIDATVAVGEARQFSRRNPDPVEGPFPPQPIIRADIPSGSYYVLFELEQSGGEEILTNNRTFSLGRTAIYLPVDDPETPGTVETANPLDFAIVGTSSRIGAVTGESFGSTITVTNQGVAVVDTTTLALDVVLSSDENFDEPAGFLDAGDEGLRLNPRDINRPVVVQLVTDTMVSDFSITQINSSSVILNVAYNPSSVAPVQSLVEALNSFPTATNRLLEAVPTAGIAPMTSTTGALLSAAETQLLARPGVTDATQTARDVFVATRQVEFQATQRPLRTQTYFVTGDISVDAFAVDPGFDPLLARHNPIKLFPLFRVRPQLILAPGDEAENTNNNVRQAANFVRFYDQQGAFFDPTTAASLPTREETDFAALQAVTQRPVNSGSIRQGQQRVFSFEIPEQGLPIEECQLLVILTTDNFDPHVDLLNAQGEFVTGSDDSALGTSPIIYTPVAANTGQRTFYLVVSAARFDESDLSGGGETFELTISVNSREQTDLGLVKAVGVANVLDPMKQFYPQEAPRIENDVLVPFSLTNTKAELLLVLPQRARVRFRSQPVFQVGVSSIITEFLAGRVPTPLDAQAQLDATASGIVYRPVGGDLNSSHILEAGAYTLAFQANASEADTQDLRLEVDTLFLPDGVD